MPKPAATTMVDETQRNPAGARLDRDRGAPSPLDPLALTRSLRGQPRAYRAEFLQHADLIRAYLAHGHTIRSVYEHLKASGSIGFSYETLRRYVRRYIPEAKHYPVVPPAISEGQGSKAPKQRGALAGPAASRAADEGATAPQAESVTGTSPAWQRPPGLEQHPMLQRRERPAYEYKPTEKTKDLY